MSATEPRQLKTLIMKMQYTVWWFEIDPFNSKVTRHNVDFDRLYLAKAYVKDLAKETKPITAFCERIVNCPWHQSRAYHGHKETI